MTVPILGELNDSICMHCKYGHGTVVCNCGHTHGEHIAMSGCHVLIGQTKEGVNLYCLCEQYSQTGLRQLKETDKQFRRRILGRVI